jgi:hypothetical protein
MGRGTSNLLYGPPQDNIRNLKSIDDDLAIDLDIEYLENRQRGLPGSLSWLAWAKKANQLIEHHNNLNEEQMEIFSSMVIGHLEHGFSENDIPETAYSKQRNGLLTFLFNDKKYLDDTATSDFKALLTEDINDLEVIFKVEKLYSQTLEQAMPVTPVLVSPRSSKRSNRSHYLNNDGRKLCNDDHLIIGEWSGSHNNGTPSWAAAPLCKSCQKKSKQKNFTKQAFHSAIYPHLFRKRLADQLSDKLINDDNKTNNFLAYQKKFITQEITQRIIERGIAENSLTINQAKKIKNILPKELRKTANINMNQNTIKLIPAVDILSGYGPS